MICDAPSDCARLPRTAAMSSGVGIVPAGLPAPRATSSHWLGSRLSMAGGA